MTIDEAYKIFPTRDACLHFLESVLWHEGPVCPYCGSKNQTPEKINRRRHCNNCNTSYSVTVATVFHHTHTDLQIWFAAIPPVLADPWGYSSRRLAGDLSITKNAAWRMLARIRGSISQVHTLRESLAEVDRLRPRPKYRPAKRFKKQNR